jgi:hypothetical protein
MKINWKKACTFDSFVESEQYFKRGRPKVVTKSNKTNCTICNNSDGHKMKVQYMDCNKNDCNGKCETRYKLMQCLNLSKCVIYSLNEHEVVVVSAPTEEQAKIKMRGGISYSTKEAIETILNVPVTFVTIILLHFLKEKFITNCNNNKKNTIFKK